MRVVLLTQDEPFFFAEAFRYLLKKMPESIQIVAAVIMKPSPFGKSESFFHKAMRTKNVFGWKFFLRYSVIFLLNKLWPSRKVLHVLRQHNVKEVFLENTINAQDSLDIISFYQPDVYEESVSHVSFEPCSPDTTIMLHTHPYKRCIASDTDMNTLSETKKNNPEVIMVVMCEAKRFSVYG